MNAVDAARAFVKERFPDCLVAFLAGSAARGHETASSDLDIIVITGEHVSYNESIYDFGWPIEVFVECVDHYQVFLRQGVDHQRLPYMAFMISEALVIKDQEGLAERIQGEAKMILEQGPSPLTEKEIKDYRYKITSVLNDFTSSEDYGESLFIVNRLTVLCSYILLLYQGHWVGEVRWLLRSLRKADAHSAQQLIEALEVFYQTGEKNNLVSFVNKVLDSIGGKFFEGYRVDHMQG